MPSTREREEHAEPAHDAHVVDHLVNPELHALLRADVISDIETKREPLEQVELEAEAAGTGEPLRAGLVGRAGAEREVKVEAADAAAEPAHLAVSQRPHQVPEEELHRPLLRLDQADEPLLALDH